PRQWVLAARLYCKALDRNPTNAPIWVQYGHALKESGDPAEAERAYRTALSYTPAVADTHLQLGHALKLQGKTEEAQAAYLRAFALDPSLADSLQELRGLSWSESQLRELRVMTTDDPGVAEHLDVEGALIPHDPINGASIRVLTPHTIFENTRMSPRQDKTRYCITCYWE